MVRRTAGTWRQFARSVIALVVVSIWLAFPAGAVVLFPNGDIPGRMEKEEVGPESPAPPPLERFVDEDKNRILDNLDRRLERAAPGEAVPVIVLFDQPLEEIDWADMRGRVGVFAEKARFRSVNGLAATLAPGQLRALSRLPLVRQIALDGAMHTMMDTAGHWFGVQKARTDFGVTGDREGQPDVYQPPDIAVCVVDTGIDAGHQDLQGKVIGWADYVNGQAQPYDDHGHGTHVAGIAAGAGKANSAYTGVAPGASLVGAKVLAANGSGTWSQVMSGIQFCIDNKDTYGIRVINLSLGAAGSSDGTDAVSQLVNAAVDAGLVMAVAAGNEGPNAYTIGTPAAAAKATTVGAMGDVGEKGFFLAYFSSRGPTADGRIKPDVAAPGWYITAAQAGTTSGYVTYSGTSMATPFVAGTVALMLDANPSLTPAQVKGLLMSTAVDWDGTGADNEYGAGRLDGYETIRAAGGFTGTNIPMPDHTYTTGSVASQGGSTWHDIPIQNAGYPLAVTMIIQGFNPNNNRPDLDLYLYDPAGNVVASSYSVKRQETIAYGPLATTGTYRLRVYAYRGSGSYSFDLSAGLSPAVSVSLTTDGAWDIGVAPLGSAVDSLAKVQTVRVDAGPADLYIRTTRFTDGETTWDLGESAGPDRVRWEFSGDGGATWQAFTAADSLHLLEAAVPEGATRDIHFRVTLPTSTSSTGQFAAAVTVVAVVP